VAALKHEPHEIEQRFGQGRGAALIRAIGDGLDLVRGVIERHRIECAARRSGILTTAHSRNTQTTTAEALTFARQLAPLSVAYKERQYARLPF
jgi:phage/plasmid primase-like uncharacterized protein